MPRFGLRLTLLLFLTFGPPLRAEGFSGPAKALDPAALAADQEAARLDYGQALRLRQQELRLGFAKIELGDGVLVPLLSPGGRLLEWLFLGEGRLEAQPPDAIEAAQLELFTGRRTLSSSFSAAFLAAPEARLRELARGGKPEVLKAAERAQAKSIFEGRAELAEREVLDIDHRLLLAALGEELALDFFAGIFETDQHGVICLGNDPEAEDPLSIGQWVTFEDEAAADPDAATAEAEKDEEAEAATTTDEAGGVWDTWIEGRDTSRPALAVNTSFEPRHYDLQVELDPADGKLSGEARIEAVAQLPSRVVKLSLHGDLEVETVNDAAGRELYFRREGETLRVFLPARLEKDQVAVLKVTYSGVFFESGKRRKSRGLRDNVAFYPHVGEVDEATYELELRWPRGWEVVAAGELLSEGKNEAGWWQKRRIAEPTWGPTFVVGKFRRRSREVAGVKVELALGSGLAGSDADLKEMLDAAASSLEFFSKVFGPYPLDELTLASAPAEISQSLLGFIALSDEMMQASGREAIDLGLEDRRTVIAHEVAHQWWGHQVGWRRWRDQWISEAMANYAAALWARRYLPDLDPVLGPNGAWQEDLTATLPDGRSLESVGPVVLGSRLDSSLTEDAYEPIVYRKGAVVIDTLCQFWGEARCLELLGKLTREQSGKKLSTADFIAELQRLSGRNLGPFAQQFIYGTGLPEVYYRSAVIPTPEGKWRVELEAEVESSYHFRYRLEKTPAGGLAIRYQRVDEIELASLDLVAPLRITMRAAGRPPRTERFVISGQRAHAVYELQEEPAKVELDPQQIVFGRFWSQQLEPKRSLYYRGYDHLAAGELGIARKSFEAALRATTPGAKEENAELDRALDTSIGVAQVRLALQESKIAEAATFLAAARKSVPKGLEAVYQSDLDYLTAVLAWHQGKAEIAYQKLEKLIFEKAEVDDTEAWLYLALAAKKANYPEELEVALAEAAARGVDVTLLQEEP